MKTSPILIRLITISLFTAVLAGTWDVWWHAAAGRETFWSAPHLLLYLSVIIAIGTGFYGWWQTRDRIWAWLAIVLFLIPASAPFDELWHRIFGVEPINSPLIIWSPPHVLLALALIASFFFLLKHLENDADLIAKHLLQSAALASILSLLLFLATPLEPTGPYHFLGFAGTGIGTGMIALVLLFAQERMQRFGSAVSVAGIFVLLAAMNFDEQGGANVLIEPHDHPPGWLLIFSLFLPALIIDLLPKKSPLIRGPIAAVLHAVILYGFAWRFFEPQFQYGSSEIWNAVISSIIGGLIAGWIVRIEPVQHFAKP